MHPVTLVASPLASHHLAPLSLRLVDMLLVIMAPVYSIWIMVDPINHAHSMLLMLMVQPLLGLPTCTDLNLVTMNFSITNHEGVSKRSTPPRPICDPDPVTEEQVLKQFKDCFEGVGCFQGEYRITVDPAVPPVVHPHEEFQRPSGSL